MHHETERTFTVLVPREGTSALVYPPSEGAKALQTMTVLAARGHVPVARTEANGITEDLSLDEMAQIYKPAAPQIHEQSSKISEPIATTLTYTRDDLEKRRRHREVTPSGVVFDGELAGPGGMSFVLLREASTTDAMLIAAVHELRCNRDVVGKIKVTSVIE